MAIHGQTGSLSRQWQQTGKKILPDSRDKGSIYPDRCNRQMMGPPPPPPPPYILKVNTPTSRLEPDSTHVPTPQNTHKCNNTNSSQSSGKVCSTPNDPWQCQKRSRFTDLIVLAGCVFAFCDWHTATRHRGKEVGAKLYGASITFLPPVQIPGITGNEVLNLGRLINDKTTAAEVWG